jgi:hypothetical protein
MRAEKASTNPSRYPVSVHVDCVDFRPMQACQMMVLEVSTAADRLGCKDTQN